MGWKNAIARVRRFAFEASCALLTILAAVVVYDVILLAPGAMA